MPAEQFRTRTVQNQGPAAGAGRVIPVRYGTRIGELLKRRVLSKKGHCIFVIKHVAGLVPPDADAIEAFHFECITRNGHFSEEATVTLIECPVSTPGHADLKF